MSRNIPLSNGRSRWLGIFLACSLAVNLLLMGIFAGHLLRPGPPGPFPPHMGWVLRHLSEQGRQQLRPELERHSQTVRPLQKDMIGAQRTVNRLLSDEHLDADRLQEALARLHEASTRFQAASHDEMLLIIKQLAPEDRKRVVRFLQKDFLPEFRSRRMRRHRMEPPPTAHEQTQ